MIWGFTKASFITALVASATLHSLYARFLAKKKAKYDACHPIGDPPSFPNPPTKPAQYEKIEIPRQRSLKEYRDKILARDQMTCQACGEKHEPHNLEVHHVIPRAKQGRDTWSNLVTLCINCHNNERLFGHRRLHPRKMGLK